MTRKALRSFVAAFFGAAPVSRFVKRPRAPIGGRHSRRLRDLPLSTLACFEDDFEACVARLRLPVTHRRFIRETNLLGRLFVEERRRLKIITNGFDEKPVLKRMFDA